jgi:GTPase SAR1 family protein
MSYLPPTYTLSVVSLTPLSGKSSLCKRLIDSNFDNYQLFLSNNKSENHSSWFYWGSIKHRRLDEKREGIFHLIEHSSLSIDDNESIENYLKRISTLTIRLKEKISSQIKTFPKDKINIDGFLCIYDILSNKSISEYLFLLHVLSKTRLPILIVTTKNDAIPNQSNLPFQFEQTIHSSLPNLPIIHTSAYEHVNNQSVLELALYACDETTRKSFHTKYIPPTYADGYKNEQSLKHVIQTEYRTLLSRHVPDYRAVSWEKFYERWQHHTSIQTFIDMFGKQQSECLFDEHIEELKRISRQKLIDERLISVIEILITDQKTKLSR